jgi:hypothetical protein
MRNIHRTLFVAFLALALSAAAFGQADLSSTSLSVAATATAKQVIVASASGITEATRPTSLGGVGNPSSSLLTVLFVDGEAMKVDKVSSTTITVTRGYAGTTPTAHALGSRVWLGPASYFYQQDPVGPCTSTSLLVLPRIVVPSGNIWTCTSSVWTAQVLNGAPVFPRATVSTVTTATAVTLTAAQVLGGMILEDPSGGAVTATLPTAALLTAAVPGVRIGDTFEFTIRNTADANETITVGAGSGNTLSGTATIAQNYSKKFKAVWTAVAAGSEAVTYYSLGTVVF